MSPSEKEGPLKYSFKTHWQLIDLAEIRKDLSYKNPIAIIKNPETQEGFVVIHQSIDKKAEICKMNRLYPNHGIRFTKDTLRDISEVVKYVRKVKLGKFPRYSKPVKFDVEILEISV
jgi:hypothetical protein